MTSSRVSHVRLAWAGGVHVFTIGRPDETLRLHDREHAILSRLIGGGWGFEDVAQTIRCGLFGGCGVAYERPEITKTERRLGLTERRLGEAHRAAVDALVEEHVAAHPLSKSLSLAQLVLIARTSGVPAHLADQGLDVEAFFIALAREAETEVADG